MSNITNAIWFSSRGGTIGVVEVMDPHDGMCYYIGTARGLSEEVDRQEIADWGASFPRAAAQTLMYGGPL